MKDKGKKREKGKSKPVHIGPVREPNPLDE
jgi:hypothetical protein